MHTIAFVLLFAGAAHIEQHPETVLVTYHTKAGSETRLAEVLVEGWKTMRRLKLVTSDPHSLVRDGSSFVEVFTWKDASIPDNAPAEVLALWKQMSGLTEPKGIDIKIVERVPTP